MPPGSHSKVNRGLPESRHTALPWLFLALTTLLCSPGASAQLSIPIGQWRAHLNQQNTIQVIYGDKLYCATATHVFSVDDAAAIQQYNKATGLSETGVRCIGWDATNAQLVIAYTNSSLDIVRGAQVRSIGDIKRSTVSGNKTINAIACRNGLAYLATGLGIIVADLSRYEIRDTWYIGSSGSQVSVNGIAFDNNSYYAATAEGLKRTPLNVSSPANYLSWQNISGTAGLPPGAVRTVVCDAGGTVFALKGDSVFASTANGWQLFYFDPNWPIININVSENKLLLSLRNGSGNARVLVVSMTGSIERALAQGGVVSLPRSALLRNGTPWVADEFGGLSSFTQPIGRYIPDGPPGTADAEMVFDKDTLFVAAGSVNSAWNYQYNRNGLFRFKDGQWSSQGYFNTPVLDSVLDFISVATDPVDHSVWAGSYGGGLVRFRSGETPVIYKQNSPLQAAIGDQGSYRVSGLAFDERRNLWISNYGAAQNLHVRKNDGSWKTFSIPFSLIENAVGQIIADEYQQLWIVSPKGNGLICYQYGQSIDNLGDDKWKQYLQGAGNGNLPGNNVLCIARDKNSFIWVGTDKGIGIIQCSAEAFSAGCEAVLPVVRQNGFNGFLFRDEQVQCIAVDGANRKWVGTKNGAWLVSDDGSRIVYRFTEDNSPLLGNDVRKIAVNPITGEVFFATANGICSFRSTATEAGTDNPSVMAFPNPVPPGYNGTIAIRGLPENALVKITEMNGRLAYQGRALGGQFVWSGKDYLGNKAASGVYLVFVRGDAGNESLATKIVIVSGR